MAQKQKYSEEEYFQMADNLIHSSCPVLRSLFRQRWMESTGSAWTQASSPRQLISGLGSEAYSKSKPIQKKLLENGNVEEWDMSLLGFLLKQIDWSRSDGHNTNNNVIFVGGFGRSRSRSWKKENRAVEQLLQLRNNSAHSSSKKLTAEAYKKIEESVRSSLELLRALGGTVPAVTLPQIIPRHLRACLQDPWRQQCLKDHRTSLGEVYKKEVEVIIGLPGILKMAQAAQPPRLPHRLPCSWTDLNLKSIKMNEMDMSKENVYEGRILNLTFMDDTVHEWAGRIKSIAEDVNGDVTIIRVYNFPPTESSKFGFGCKLSVINPYLKIGLGYDDDKDDVDHDELPFICVDDPKCIIYNEGVPDMCRYCGEANAPRKCGNCKWANYCSRDCQVKDWKIMKHKLVCVRHKTREEIYAGMVK